MIRETPIEKKVWLAIAFAGGMLNAQPAMCDQESNSTRSVIEQVDEDTQVVPEVRAYYLLRLADCYLNLGGESTALNEMGPILKGWARGMNASSLQTQLSTFASDSCLPGHANVHQDEFEPETPLTPSSMDSRARLALSRAMGELSVSTDNFDRLVMYFVASKLYQQAGLSDQAESCKEVFNKALSSCEKKSSVDEPTIKAAWVILNAQAFDLLPLGPPDRLDNQRRNVFRERPSPIISKYDDLAFKQSEELKLRVASLVDRLSPGNDLRRLTHRNLVLWYQRLGKTDLADKQKNMLFELVGVHDDRILYPQIGACGHPVWWLTEPPVNKFSCGMG
ncbi:MAG TPA: hypothetical protein V6C81_13645 [Planktothrix sp.]|jgi:hypothetical protein